MGRSRRSRASRATTALAGRVALTALGALFALLPGLLSGAVLAHAAPAAERPKPACTVTDARLAELSGLAADERHWYAIADGGTTLRVFVLDRSCAVRDVITGAIDPYDVEDLAVAHDGTLWLADTGDNSGRRDTVAVHTLRPDGTALLHRLTYPDGKHDAEALLLGPSGVPHIVTKSVLGASGVYRPATRLRSPGPTPLTRVAEVSIPASSTRGGPAGAASSALITGGAVNRDGTVIALRTYTDAYLYPAPDGHLVAALSRQPVRIPLPNEPQGEAIAFTPGGTLLSAGEGSGQPIRAVPGAVGRATASQPPTEHPTEERKDAASRTAREAGLDPLPAAAAVLLITGAVWLGIGQLSKLRNRVRR